MEENTKGKAVTEKQIAAKERARQMLSNLFKIDVAKKEHRKRQSNDYHRNKYRTLKGIPLDAPVMTPSECAKKARKARLKKLKTKKENL